jgi:hypothetical protein
VLGPWKVPADTVDTVLRGAIRCVVSRPDTCTLTPRMLDSVGLEDRVVVSGIPVTT